MKKWRPSGVHILPQFHTSQVDVKLRGMGCSREEVIKTGRETIKTRREKINEMGRKTGKKQIKEKDLVVS